MKFELLFYNLSIMDKENREKEISEKGQGRIRPVSVDLNNPGPGQSQRDISEIDRQEGDMAHGELGGNFNQQNKDHEK